MENIDIDDLYREVQDDLNRVVGPLFEFGESQVRKRGAFLPFGATLNVSGEVGMEAASAEEEYSSAMEILPILHEGLRARVKKISYQRWQFVSGSTSIETVSEPMQ